MSKHFELMQRIESDRTFSPGFFAGPGAGPFAETKPLVRHVRESSASGRWGCEEALRLVQQVFLMQAPAPPRVVVFAGIEHGNGCSRICAAVAETLAHNTRVPVCLVEANFRSPSLTELFATPPHFGLAEALVRKEPISFFTQPVDQQNLWLLSAGTVAGNSPNLLTGDLLRPRLNEVSKEFNFVIIDSPPLTSYSDALVLGQLADGVVLVLEAESTRREAATVAAESLRTAKIPILAAVLNKRNYPIPETIYGLL